VLDDECEAQRHAIVASDHHHRIDLSVKRRPDFAVRRLGKVDDARSALIENASRHIDELTLPNDEDALCCPDVFSRLHAGQYSGRALTDQRNLCEGLPCPLAVLIDLGDACILRSRDALRTAGEGDPGSVSSPVWPL
jgi:hypothetical protein